MPEPALDPNGASVSVGPHDYRPRDGWFNRLRGICTHCYAPKSLHPRTVNVKARPLGDNRFISADAPHFKEGW